MNLTPEVAHLILAAVDGSTKHEVVGFLGDIAICEAWHKPPFADARFTGVLFRHGKWIHTSQYSSSVDAAVLHTLGYKYDGGMNSRFGMFAARMLEFEKP